MRRRGLTSDMRAWLDAHGDPEDNGYPPIGDPEPATARLLEKLSDSQLEGIIDDPWTIVLGRHLAVQERRKRREGEGNR